MCDVESIGSGGYQNNVSGSECLEELYFLFFEASW